MESTQNGQANPAADDANIESEVEEILNLLQQLPENNQAFLHGMAVAFRIQADAKASA